MTERGTRRAARRQRRGGPAPEFVAAILVVVLYGTALMVGLPALPPIDIIGFGGTEPTPTPITVGTPSPGVATPDPLRADVDAILVVDSRLLDYRSSLQELLAATPIRSSEIATILRRVSATVPFGLERASRLSQDPRTQAAGSQLEILYANADATADRALDLAISSETAYRDAAEEIVDMFADLPTIDAVLLAAVQSGAQPSADTSAGPGASAPPSAAPSAAPSPPASAAASGSPAPTRSPNEMLRNPGFDDGLPPWTLVLRSAEDQATTRPDLPIAPVGTAALRIDIKSISATPDGIRVGQGNLAIRANVRYSVRIVVQSTVERSVRLRVAGPNQEVYSVRVATAGPAASTIAFEFSSIVDDPAVSLWVDIAGPVSGTVWLDEAAFAPVTPG
jgi:hypothetical protein